MSITSVAYLVFLGVVVIALHFLRHGSAARRQVLLIAASYLFYGSLHWASLASLLGVTLVAHWGGNAVKAGANRGWLLASVIGLLLAQWALFQVVPSLPQIAIDRLASIGLDLDPFIATLFVPLGLSFYSFIAIGYLVDVHSGRVEPARSGREVALLVGFFPHVLSGPIGRADRLLPQFRTLGGANRQQSYEGLALMVRGFAKKLLVADLLGTLIVDPAFAYWGTKPGGFLLLALYAYTFQIYFDLSGYTDLARGAAKLIGVELMENFHDPYLARSVSQFWTRWHISMSSFFRDYLYFPLGGSKSGNVYLNLMLTFFAIGMWHDIGWTFAVYGLLHGSVVALERYDRTHRGFLNRVPAWACILVTFHFVVLSRVLFRSQDLPNAAGFVEQMTSSQGWSPVATISSLQLTLLVLAALLAFFGSWIQGVVRRHLSFAPNLSLACSIVTLALLATAFQVERKSFLYFAF